jgi:hypothetical protein
MTRSTFHVVLSSLLLVTGCGGDQERPEPGLIDCSQGDGYEFQMIADFSGMETQWFRYADPTPGSYPDPDKLQVEDPMSDDEGSNVPPTQLESPGRCDDTGILKLEASGHNFWGAGFGEWGHNAPGSHADGSGFDGISFWARSPRDAEKSFVLNVDDSRTMVNPPASPDPDDPVEAALACETDLGLLPPATSADEDLDGDGCIGPGDIVSGTTCRLPPPEEVGDAACYNGGVNRPSSAGQRVPEADECGNPFHTLINTTEEWQLFLIPWRELVQWPCPNRLDGGIDESDIAKFEILLFQGTRYEIWIDEIAFYRKR